MDAELVADAESDLSAVEAALARLDDGTYGTCEACGARIDDSVLADDPVASRCASCSVASPAAALTAAPRLTTPADPAEE